MVSGHARTARPAPPCLTYCGARAREPRLPTHPQATVWLVRRRSGVQAQVRGHQQRKKAKSAKVVADMDIDLEDPEVHAAASKIQAGVRGRQVRKEAAEQNAAATKIQAQFRGHQSRKGGGEGAEDGEADETEPVDDAAAYDIDLADPEVNESATKIQAQFRGHQVRKEAAEQNAAATKIQAQFRGHQARKGGDETADTTGIVSPLERLCQFCERWRRVGPAQKRPAENSAACAMRHGSRKLRRVFFFSLS